MGAGFLLASPPLVRGIPVQKVAIFSVGTVTIYNQDVRALYEAWPTPDVIVSDGGYGVSGFPGDPHEHSGLASWYADHIRAWATKSRPGSTLWFWNTELGWATVHPLLEAAGWDYVCCNVWNKGIAHIAGNCNLPVLKGFPVVTEVCVQYVRRAEFLVDGQKQPLKVWLRHEWERTGIPLSKANEACGVANAATRKYLTKDHLWYAPPTEVFSRLSAYANKHGIKSGRPYFSIDGRYPLSSAQYDRLFPTFQGKYGITNVWTHPPLHNGERLRIRGSTKYTHLNQKPLALVSLTIDVSSQPGDIVWEPFGGLCTGALASLPMGRTAFAAEIDPLIFKAAVSRFSESSIPLFLSSEDTYKVIKENAETDAYSPR
jgi:site-specific DNA-methyltransferase (adenine-specific)